MPKVMAMILFTDTPMSLVVSMSFEMALMQARLGPVDDPEESEHKEEGHHGDDDGKRQNADLADFKDFHEPVWPRDGPGKAGEEYDAEVLDERRTRRWR